MKPWQFFLLVSFMYGATNLSLRASVAMQFLMLAIAVVAYFKGPK
jgi:hypothetical protein